MVKKVKRVLAVMITLVLMVSMLSNSKLIVLAENSIASEQESTKMETITGEVSAMEGDKQAESSTVEKGVIGEQKLSEDTKKEMLAGERDKTKEEITTSETEAQKNTSEKAEKVTASSEENKQEKLTVTEINEASEQETKQESADTTAVQEERQQEIQQNTADQKEETLQATTEQPKEDALQSTIEQGQQDTTQSAKEQEVKPYEAEAVVDQTRIKVTAKAGVLPNDAVLKATALKEDGETSAQYSEAKAALDKDSSIEYDGFMAYDIGFTDSTGQEIEPTGKVSVSMEMATPEGAKTESLSVQHHEKTDAGIQVETVADAKNETTGKVDVQGQETVAEFEVESFSTFTITWSSGDTKYFEITVHYVNTNGGEIDEPTHNNMTISNGESITLSELAPNVSGLTYQKAYYGSYGGSQITSVEASESGNYYKTRKLSFKDGSKTIESLTWSGWDSETKHADIYLEYKTDNVTPPSPTPTKSLSKNKTVISNGDGTYNLNLDISGAVGTVTNKAKLDILLIIDRSGSMDNTDSGRITRMEAAKNAAKSLIDTVNSKNATIDAQYAVVSFCSNGYYKRTNADGPAKASKTEQDWSSNISSVKASIDNIGVEGGTNYQSGISLGKTVLKNARTDAQKVVIFLTDGLPTYRLDSGRPTGQAGDGKHDDDGENQAAAVGEIKGMGCDQFYAIGVGSDFINNKDNAKDNLDELATNVGQEANQRPSKTAVYAASSSDLSKIFDDIAASTTSFLCDHVEVTDTLSENVEVVTNANGAPTNLLIKVTKADGAEITSENSELTTDENGNYVISMTLPATEENGEATIKATYSNGKITMKFDPETYKLEAGWTYQVTTTIKATEKAYQNYRDNGGYVDTADAGTGTHENDTGLYSNVNEEAKVSYTYDGKNSTENFDKPVIQLNPGTLVIEKEITGLDNDQEALNALKASLVFDVSLNNATESEEYKISAFTYNEESKKYTYTINGLSPNTSYKITEKGTTVSGYDLTQTPASGDAEGTVAGGETKTVAFTNAYTPSNRTITVKKVVDGNMSDSNKEFDFTYKIEKEGKDPVEGSFKLKDGATHNIEEIPSGSTVTITETDNDGYKTSWSIGGNTISENQKSYSCDVTENMTSEDKMIVCTNTKNAITPTGMTHTQTPFALMLITALFLAVCGFGGFMFHRVRGRR